MWQGHESFLCAPSIISCVPLEIMLGQANPFARGDGACGMRVHDHCECTLRCYFRGPDAGGVLLWRLHLRLWKDAPVRKENSVASEDHLSPRATRTFLYKSGEREDFSGETARLRMCIIHSRLPGNGESAGKSFWYFGVTVRIGAIDHFESDYRSRSTVVFEPLVAWYFNTGITRSNISLLLDI